MGHIQGAGIRGPGPHTSYIQASYNSTFWGLNTRDFYRVQKAEIIP